MAGTKVFSAVGNLKPDRNLFDLSKKRNYNIAFGVLAPVLAKQVVPGDVIKCGQEVLVRMDPSFVPFNNQIDINFYYFFVPHRVLDKRSESGLFESFISGGLRGTETRDCYRMSTMLTSPALAKTWNKRFGICDYLRMCPADILTDNADSPAWSTFGSWFPARLQAFPTMAYNKVYIDYFADENLETDKFENSDGVFDGGDRFVHTNVDILKGNYTKDYFTSALPFQQRGTAPALPISGILDVVGSDVTSFSGGSVYLEGVNASPDGGAVTVSPNSILYGAGDQVSGIGINGPVTVDGLSVNLENATTFDVADLRYAFQIQKFLERNARAGVRYTEFLKSHFGVSPTDSRLDRAEYLGGSKGHVMVSEVLQTSASSADGDLGQYAGHGLSAFSDFAVDGYHVEEFGTFLCVMLIKPRTGYFQGVPREWMWGDRFEWYMPEFAHLSEQAIASGELYVDANTTEDQYDEIFGYQGVYDELRTDHDDVAGDLVDNMDYWHLNRKFASMPQLNEEFIKVDAEADDLNRVFNYEGTTDAKAHPFIVSLGFNLSMLRPMPFIPEPGLIDHF